MLYVKINDTLYPATVTGYPNNPEWGCRDTKHITVEMPHAEANDMLVEGADTLVAWWNGAQSGTAYTVKRAKKLGISIINIYPKNQLSIEFTD